MLGKNSFKVSTKHFFSSEYPNSWALKRRPVSNSLHIYPCYGNLAKAPNRFLNMTLNSAKAETQAFSMRVRIIGYKKETMLFFEFLLMHWFNLLLQKCFQIHHKEICAECDTCLLIAKSHHQFWKKELKGKSKIDSRTERRFEIINFHLHILDRGILCFLRKECFLTMVRHLNGHIHPLQGTKIQHNLLPNEIKKYIEFRFKYGYNLESVKQHNRFTRTSAVGFASSFNHSSHCLFGSKSFLLAPNVNDVSKFGDSCSNKHFDWSFLWEMKNETGFLLNTTFCYLYTPQTILTWKIHQKH